MITECGSKAEADTFGRNRFPEFCGESIEIDPDSRADAEEFWGVRCIRLSRTHAKHVWVPGPELPEDVEADGLLTSEDRAALTLDHITRTSDLIGRFQIRLQLPV